MTNYKLVIYVSGVNILFVKFNNMYCWTWVYFALTVLWS